MHTFSSLCTFTRACQDSDPQLHAATAAGGEARILKTQWPSLQELTLTLIACSQQVWAPVGVPLLCRKISLTVSFDHGIEGFEDELDLEDTSGNKARN